MANTPAYESVDELTGIIIEDFESEVEVMSDTLSLQVSRSGYQLIKSYVDGLLDAIDVVPIVRNDLLTLYEAKADGARRLGFKNVEEETKQIKNKISGTPDEVFFQALERAKPKLAALITRIEEKLQIK